MSLYPCGKCGKEVTDQEPSIGCELGCDSWYHVSCTGLTARAFQLLGKDSRIRWACDRCANHAPSALPRLPSS
eukprot:m.353283 g.353283  ORF g.353283 m.353283 type:complete len:73 (+) comp16720_c0_seq1:446-664(+)